ncbi:MAG: winged helix-turn-helix domain-containing protein, partial [Myxococcota bacterium]
MALKHGEIDLLKEEVRLFSGAVHRLTAKEVAVLRYLEAHSNRTVSRDELQTEVWGYAPDVISRAVDNTIRRLRQKIELDSSAPEHVVTVFGEGYRLSGAAAAAPPQTRPSFFGRADALAAIREAFQRGARLVTLTGPGGIGKTRLSQEWLLDDPGIFVDLVDATGKADISVALVRAMEAKNQNAALTALIHGPPRLVVLDNCEQIRDDARQWAERILQQAAGLRILVTSRHALELDGEQVITLASLSVEAGAQLLVHHAIANAAAPPDEAWMAALVERLDGLPLALEMAAARLGVLGPSELLARLDQALDLLRRRGDATRHGTLRATVAWSWELLPAWAQCALARCTVFRGGFSAAAAEAVVAPLPEESPDVLDVLDHLRRSSLLQARGEPGGRRRLYLLEGVRQFAAEQRQPDDALQTRHAQFYAAVPPHLRRYNHLNQLAAFEWARQTDPQLALTLAESLAEGFRAHGPPERWMQVVHALQAMPLEGTQAAQARLLDVEAREALGHNRDPAALESIVASARAVGARELEARALIARARWQRQNNAHRAAEETYQQALAAQPSVGMQAHLYFDLASLNANLQRHDAAVRLYREALERFEVLDDQHRITRTALHLAMVLSEQGALDEARQRAQRALQYLVHVGDEGGEGVVRSHLAIIALEARDLEEAEAQITRAQRCHRAVGARRFEGYGHLLFAMLAQARDQHMRMATEAAQAIISFNKVND